MPAGDRIKIGMIIPVSGPAGLFGPSSRNCAELAAYEINKRGGILDRQIDLIYVDGGQHPSNVASVVATLVDNAVVDALIGMHDSDVRRAVIDANKARLPYIYTPTYEGGEDAPGVFAIGETPQQQMKPVVPWLRAHRGIRQWYLIGNDYSWPRKLHAAAQRYILDAGGHVAGQHYVPFETDDFADYIDDIGEKKPDCVLMSLVGDSSVAFNRAFAEAELFPDVLRFGPLMEENTLLAIGLESSRNLLSATGYFSDIDLPENREFIRHYTDRFGVDAPVITFLSQSCYKGWSCWSN